MCLSVPLRRVRDFERLDNPEDPEAGLPFVVNTGVHPWTVQSVDAGFDLIEQDHVGLHEVDYESYYGLFGPDDPDLTAEDLQSWHLAYQEEEERRWNVWRGVRRPRDDDDWREIFESYSQQQFNLFGISYEFFEWSSLWGDEEEI